MIIFIAMIKNINAQPVTNLVYDIGVYVITTTEKEMEPHFTAVEISNLRLVKTFQLLAIVKEIGAIKVSQFNDVDPIDILFIILKHEQAMPHIFNGFSTHWYDLVEEFILCHEESIGRWIYGGPRIYNPKWDLASRRTEPLYYRKDEL